MGGRPAGVGWQRNRPQPFTLLVGYLDSSVDEYWMKCSARLLMLWR